MGDFRYQGRLLVLGGRLLGSLPYYFTVAYSIPEHRGTGAGKDTATEEGDREEGGFAQ